MSDEKHGLEDEEKEKEKEDGCSQVVTMVAQCGRCLVRPFRLIPDSKDLNTDSIDFHRLNFHVDVFFPLARASLMGSRIPSTTYTAISSRSTYTHVP